MRMALFLVGLLAWPIQLRVEIRDSEVWVVRDGREYQFTHDGKSKLQAKLSPVQKRIAYYEQSIDWPNCPPTLA